MHRRHPVPRLWLMTDERIGDALWPALRQLARGSGVVFRHYATPPEQRRQLFERIRRIARSRGLVLVAAGDPKGARMSGCHGRGRCPAGFLRTWPAHDRAEAVAGKRAGAVALFVSPIFPTQSHPGSPVLGPRAALALGRGLGMPIIALGGMNAKRFARLNKFGFYGWAAIDALVPISTKGQKRNAVPI